MTTKCYSGSGAGKNNPDQQCIRNIGPVPATTYRLETCQNYMHGSTVRPCSFWMYPVNGDGGFDEVCGRSEILIHGCRCCESNDLDHTEPPVDGCSAGCVIMNIENRKQLRIGDTVKVYQYDPKYKNGEFLEGAFEHEEDFVTEITPAME